MLREWALETSLKIDNTKDDSKIGHLQVTQPGIETYIHGGTATSLSKCKARAAGLFLFLQDISTAAFISVSCLSSYLAPGFPIPSSYFFYTYFS